MPALGHEHGRAPQAHSRRRRKNLKGGNRGVFRCGRNLLPLWGLEWSRAALV